MPAAMGLCRMASERNSMKTGINRKMIAAAAVTAAVVIAALCLGRVKRTSMVNRTGATFEKGVVQEILQDNLNEDGTRAGDQKVAVLMNTGVRKGKTVEMNSSSGYLFGAVCKKGMHVVVMQSVSGKTTISSVYSPDRGQVLILFGVLYLLAVCLVGGRQGVRASAGLLFTGAVILYIWIPLICLGFSPIATAVLICAATTALTFWCIGGICTKTVAATAGTVAGVVIAGVMAAVFSKATGVSGWNVSDIEALLTIYQTNRVQVGELLFAGILISALGAQMDVAMSISSSMQEICRQNPEIGRRELVHAGMRIGRDMMGTDSNTLILAFVGTSVSQLVLNFAYDLPVLQVLNSNNIGICVMQGLSGSFGIILSVPATVQIAACLLRHSCVRPCGG